MSSFQDVRGAMARLTGNALVAGGVLPMDQYWDNVRETPPAGIYAVVSISFPSSWIQSRSF